MLDWGLVVPFLGVCVVRGYRRKGLAIAIVVLFVAAFPPLNLPTWWFCLAPSVFHQFIGTDTHV